MNSETVSFDIDYQFIANAVTAQAQMLNLLSDFQFLELEELKVNEDDNLIHLVCSVHEEKVN